MGNLLDTEIINEDDRRAMLIYSIRNGFDSIPYKYLDDERFVRAYIEISDDKRYLHDLSPRLQYDVVVAMHALEKGWRPDDVHKRWILSDKLLVMAFYRGHQGPRIFQDITSFKVDRDFALEVVRINPLEYKNMPIKYQDDFDITLEAVRGRGKMIYYASERLQRDDELWRAAITQDVYTVVKASEGVRDDYDLMDAIVEKAPWALKYASARLKDDEPFVTKVVTKHPRMLQYASARLINNRTLLKMALDDKQACLKDFFSKIELGNILHFKDTIIEQSGGAINLQAIHDHHELMVDFVKRYPGLIKHASTRLVNDKRFLEQILEDSFIFFIHILPRMEYTTVVHFKDVIVEHIKNKPSMFAHLPDSVLRDTRVVNEIVTQVPALDKHLGYVCPERVLDETVDEKAARRRKHTYIVN